MKRKNTSEAPQRESQEPLLHEATLDAAWAAEVPRKPVVVAVAVVGVLSLVAAAGTAHVADVEFLLVNGYYHFTWVLVVALVATLVFFWRSVVPEASAQRRRLAVCALVGALGAGTVFSAADTEYRILADEANLLGLSMSLNHDRTYRNILEGSYYYDRYHPTVYTLDPRPSLHPFLVSLLHDLRGYDARHAFAVNFAATGVAVGLVFHVALALAGWFAAIGAAVLLVANPIFALGGTSSGFEPLNLAVTTFALWSLFGFYREPTARRLTLMVFAAVAAAHCRYESVLLVFPVAAAILLKWKELRFDRSSWLLLLAPILLVPYVWQRQLHALHHEVDASKPVFGVQYLGDNLYQFLRFAFDRGGPDFPMNHWIACLAAGGLVLLAVHLARGYKEDPSKTGALLVALGFGSVFLLHMLCWVVDFRTVAVQRYAISYASAFALLGVWPLLRLWTVPWGRILAAGVLAFTLFHGLAKAGHNTQGRWLTLYREYKMNLGWLYEQPRAGTLFISDRPGMYAVHQYGSMSFESANRNPRAIHDSIRRKLTPLVVVEQRVRYDRPHEPTPKLSDQLQTEPLFEYQNDAHYFIRLSRVLPREELTKNP